MTDKLQVKEHLRNGALYRPLSDPSLGGEWKRRLLYQHALNQQLKAALWESPHLLRQFICIGVPIVCIALAMASYFGLIHPKGWAEIIVPDAIYNVPPIGLKEVFVFIALVNGLTLLVRKRAFLL